MKALVYHGPGQKAWEDAADPVIIDDTDAIVRVDATTICGTDLHILKGDVPAVTDGRILGHEAVGHRRDGRRRREDGRRSATGCSSRASPPAARAASAARAATASASAAAAGSSATRSTAPRPSTSGSRSPTPRPTRCPPASTDEQILMLADILPTGYEVGVLNGAVQPGDVVAVVGAGPIGLAAIMGARLFSPSHIVAIDLADSRLEAAKQFGADVVVNNVPRGRRRGHRRADRRPRRRRRRSKPSAFPPPSSRPSAWSGPGGHVANIGVHGEPATLHLEDLWIRDVTITTGLVDTYTTPTLLRLLLSQQLDAGRFVTHHFTLDQFDEAYDVFARAADTGALKVVLTPT